MNGLSLFANVGIAETYLNDIGINIVVANELLENRCKFYKHCHPKTNVICGDIKDTNIYNKVIDVSKKANVSFIIATPPCQGMSLAGLKNPQDPRNSLVKYAIDAIIELKPKYALLENVVQQLKTWVEYNGKKITIPEYIEKRLGELYNINKDKIVNAMDYGVPQNRQRAIFLFSRKDNNYIWEFPKKHKRIITLEDAIGSLPSLDPLVKEEEKRCNFPEYDKKLAKAMKLSKYHVPKMTPWRQIEAMMHTPTGQSAFKNEVYFPKNSEGRKIKGGAFTYMRMDWKKPAPTVTMYNGSISSFTNVHPGRKLADGTFSDPRVLTLYELFIITSLPTNWNPPSWASENLIRQVIGEAIPPLLIKEIVSLIAKEENLC